MLRPKFSEELKAAMREKNTTRITTLRLIMSALKDRDISVREKGNYEGIPDAEILQLLQGMIKQRKESILMYEQGERPDLVAKENQEIQVIQEFLPKPLNEEETQKILTQTIEKLNAHSIKDIGRVMTELRENYVGSMDFSHVASVLKERLK